MSIYNCSFRITALFLLPFVMGEAYTSSMGQSLSPSIYPTTPTQTLPGQSAQPAQTTPPKTPAPPKKAEAPKPKPKPKEENKAHKPPETFYYNSEAYKIHPQPTTDDSSEVLSLIENQVTSIQSHNLPKAYFDYTSPEFQKATSLEEFKYFIDSFPVLSKNKNAIFGNLIFKRPGIGSIQGTMTSTTGESLKIEYDLIKEGHQWKILGIQIFRPNVQIEQGPMPGPEPQYDFQRDIH